MQMFDFSTSGGVVMLALLLLGLILYFLMAERILSKWSDSEEHEITGMRREGVIRALIALAPMLGLLGTVCGIIQTFSGLSSGNASQEIAQGIHSALSTTEYGLAIAIPAYLLERFIPSGPVKSNVNVSPGGQK